MDGLVVTSRTYLTRRGVQFRLIEFAHPKLQLGERWHNLPDELEQALWKGNDMYEHCQCGVDMIEIYEHKVVFWLKTSQKL